MYSDIKYTEANNLVNFPIWNQLDFYYWEYFNNFSAKEKKVLCKYPMLFKYILIVIQKSRKYGYWLVYISFISFKSSNQIINY